MAFTKNVSSRRKILPLIPPQIHLPAYLTGGLKKLYHHLRSDCLIVPVYENGQFTDENGHFQLTGTCIMASRYRVLTVIGTSGQSAVLIRAERSSTSVDICTHHFLHEIINVFLDMFWEDEVVVVKVLHTTFLQLGSQETHCLQRLRSVDPDDISHTVKLLLGSQETHCLQRLRSVDPDDISHTVKLLLGSQETHCLQRLRSVDPDDISTTVKLLNVFMFDGHYCMVFEALQPDPITRVFLSISREQLIPSIRKVALRLLTVLGFLHRENVIHADLKPDNILLKKKGDLSSLKVIDFGNAIHYVHKEVSLYYEDFEVQTPLYRAPEVVFGIPFGSEIDMWSLGCILAELFAGKPLFLGSDDLSILKMMTETLGPLPASIFQRGKFYPKLKSYTGSASQKNVCEILMKHLGCRDYKFCLFLTSCLQYNPDKRLKPSEAILHPFLAPEVPVGFLLGSQTEKAYPTVYVPDYDLGPHIATEIKRSQPSSLDLLRMGTHVIERDCNESDTSSQSSSGCPVAKVNPFKSVVSGEGVAREIDNNIDQNSHVREIDDNIDQSSHVREIDDNIDLNTHRRSFSEFTASKHGVRHKTSVNNSYLSPLMQNQERHEADCHLSYDKPSSKNTTQEFKRENSGIKHRVKAFKDIKRDSCQNNRSFEKRNVKVHADMAGHKCTKKNAAHVNKKDTRKRHSEIEQDIVNNCHGITESDHTGAFGELQKCEVVSLISKNVQERRSSLDKNGFDNQCIENIISKNQNMKHSLANKRIIEDKTKTGDMSDNKHQTRGIWQEKQRSIHMSESEKRIGLQDKQRRGDKLHNKHRKEGLSFESQTSNDVYQDNERSEDKLQDEHRTKGMWFESQMSKDAYHDKERNADYKPERKIVTSPSRTNFTGNWTSFPETIKLYKNENLEIGDVTNQEKNTNKSGIIPAKGGHVDITKSSDTLKASDRKPYPKYKTHTSNSRARMKGKRQKYLVPNSRADQITLELKEDVENRRKKLKFKVKKEDPIESYEQDGYESGPEQNGRLPDQMKIEESCMIKPESNNQFINEVKLMRDFKEEHVKLHTDFNDYPNNMEQVRESPGHNSFNSSITELVTQNMQQSKMKERQEVKLGHKKGSLNDVISTVNQRRAYGRRKGRGRKVVMVNNNMDEPLNRQTVSDRTFCMNSQNKKQIDMENNISSDLKNDCYKESRTILKADERIDIQRECNSNKREEGSGNNIRRLVFNDEKARKRLLFSGALKPRKSKTLLSRDKRRENIKRPDSKSLPKHLLGEPYELSPEQKLKSQITGRNRKSATSKEGVPNLSINLNNYQRNGGRCHFSDSNGSTSINLNNYQRNGGRCHFSDSNGSTSINLNNYQRNGGRCNFSDSNGSTFNLDWSPSCDNKETKFEDISVQHESMSDTQNQTSSPSIGNRLASPTFNLTSPYQVKQGTNNTNVDSAFERLAQQCEKTGNRSIKQMSSIPTSQTKRFSPYTKYSSSRNDRNLQDNHSTFGFGSPGNVSLIMSDEEQMDYFCADSDEEVMLLTI